MTVDRRGALKLGASALALGGGALIGVAANGQGRTTVNLQLGWLLSGNQIGEACAKGLGYYDQEGISLAFQPGGPNIDGVAIVASGKFDCGQVASSPSLMLAVSQDIPVRCFAIGGQQHPYTFFSLKKNPIREPKDLIGKKVGIQATGIILLKALLAKNRIDEGQVTIIPAGADMTPLLTGQVDAFTGWQTNTTALRVLGEQRVDMRLWDAGVRLYALPYYATLDTLNNRRDVLERFLSATAKGWEFAYNNHAKAVDLLVKEFPNLKPEDELQAVGTMLTYAFNDNTRKFGWGAMDPVVWQEQIDLHAELKQFSKRVPKVDEVMTLDILKATNAARPRLG